MFVLLEGREIVMVFAAVLFAGVLTVALEDM